MFMPLWHRISLDLMPIRHFLVPAPVFMPLWHRISQIFMPIRHILAPALFTVSYSSIGLKEAGEENQ